LNSLQEESKEQHPLVVEDEKVQMAVDPLSQAYFERFVKGWELAWKKGEQPTVLTAKEI